MPKVAPPDGIFLPSERSRSERRIRVLTSEKYRRFVSNGRIALPAHAFAADTGRSFAGSAEPACSSRLVRLAAIVPWPLFANCDLGRGGSVKTTCTTPPRQCDCNSLHSVSVHLPAQESVVHSRQQSAQSIATQRTEANARRQVSANFSVFVVAKASLGHRGGQRRLAGAL